MRRSLCVLIFLSTPGAAMQGVIDCHAHIFPALDGASGFDSAALHLFYQQWAMHNHSNQPIRRLRDHQAIVEKPLWDSSEWSEIGRREGISFRVGKFGRFEWEEDSESYYIQFLPPSLQRMDSPCEFLIAQMDHAGIEKAILQNDHIYGNLNEYFADAVSRYPDRFVGLIQIEEAFAYRDDQLEILTAGVQRHRLAGLYFSMSGFVRSGYQPYYDADEFDPFWRLVEKLGIPVFWVFPGKSPWGGFHEEMAIFLRWLERYPSVTSVLVHGIPTPLLVDESDCITWTPDIESIMDQFPVHSEILYPIMWGGRSEYPYRRADLHIRQLLDRFGSHRFLWGSDMPNVERYCTYRQSLTYFSEHAEYLSKEDRDRIFRANALDVLSGNA